MGEKKERREEEQRAAEIERLHADMERAFADHQHDDELLLRTAHELGTADRLMRIARALIDAQLRLTEAQLNHPQLNHPASADALEAISHAAKDLVAVVDELHNRLRSRLS